MIYNAKFTFEGKASVSADVGIWRLIECPFESAFLRVVLGRLSGGVRPDPRLIRAIPSKPNGYRSWTRRQRLTEPETEPQQALECAFRTRTDGASTRTLSTFKTAMAVFNDNAGRKPLMSYSA